VGYTGVATFNGVPGVPWKAQVDLTTGVPVIKKEAVKSEKKVAHS